MNRDKEMFDQLLQDLKKAHDLFGRSQSPLDKEYLTYTWKKLDTYMFALTMEDVPTEFDKIFKSNLEDILA
jgi:uncharacterized protein YjgD (DUF1641 family)